MRIVSALTCAVVLLLFCGIRPAAAQFNLDHYKCYKVKDLKNPKFEKTTISLSDQFGIVDGVYEAKKPYVFCNPVDKNGEGILNADDHLTCYKAKGPKLNPAQRPKLQVVNQLGTLQLQAKKAFLLCVPSTKTVI
jgi:hypothetical protein